jgi:hypothetical protein
MIIFFSKFISMKTVCFDCCSSESFRVVGRLKNESSCSCSRTPICTELNSLNKEKLLVLGCFDFFDQCSGVRELQVARRSQFHATPHIHTFAVRYDVNFKRFRARLLDVFVDFDVGIRKRSLQSLCQLVRFATVRSSRVAVQMSTVKYGKQPNNRQRFSPSFDQHFEIRLCRRFCFVVGC